MGFINKTIAIIGYGYVGKAIHEFFKNHYSIIEIYDKAWDYSDDSILDRINRCDLGIVCVPTPSLDDGACDISQVIDVISWLKTPLILIKSTIAVGTTDHLKKLTNKRIVFSPEYCGESSYWSPYRFHTDMKEVPFFIFGGDPRDTSEVIDFFLPVTGPVKTYRQTTAKAAELAKYMENTFYATKITFCYEYAKIAERLGVDFNEARELWLLDPRINPMHTAVFKSNRRPFSGKCLPKDLKAIIQVTNGAGYKSRLLECVDEINETS